MIGRREFITLLGGAIATWAIATWAIATWPLTARAQQGERVRLSQRVIVSL